jgi:hypothetical protein
VFFVLLKLHQQFDLHIKIIFERDATIYDSQIGEENFVKRKEEQRSKCLYFLQLLLSNAVIQSNSE